MEWEWRLIDFSSSLLGNYSPETNFISAASKTAFTDRKDWRQLNYFSSSPCGSFICLSFFLSLSLLEFVRSPFFPGPRYRSLFPASEENFERVPCPDISFFSGRKFWALEIRIRRRRTTLEEPLFGKSYACEISDFFRGQEMLLVLPLYYSYPLKKKLFD